MARDEKASPRDTGLKYLNVKEFPALQKLVNRRPCKRSSVK